MFVVHILLGEGLKRCVLVVNMIKRNDKFAFRFLENHDLFKYA